MWRTVAADRGAEGHEPIARQVPPYAGLAAAYDRLVGAALFPAIRDSFEDGVARLGIDFGSVADVGCGTGVFLDYLRRYGVPLMGVDAAVPMLRVAAARLRGTGVLLSRQDMRRLRLPWPVDLITCNGDTLNYLLNAHDLRQTLGACRDNLTAGGMLMADLLVGVPQNSIVGIPKLRIRAPGCVIHWHAQVHRRRRLTRVAIGLGQRTPQGWRWAREVHRQRWYLVSELHEACAAVDMWIVDQRVLQDGGRRGEAGAWIKLVARRDG